jgi:hypothetical protein
LASLLRATSEGVKLTPSSASLSSAARSGTLRVRNDAGAATGAKAVALLSKVLIKQYARASKHHHITAHTKLFKNPRNVTRHYDSV